MTKAEIQAFEALQGQIESLYEELISLAKKSGTDPLNKFKLRVVNGLVRRANEILGSKRIPLQDFDCFEDADLPSNSDVLIVIGQYLSALETLRSENIDEDGGWYWKLTDARGKDLKLSEMRTAPPRKILGRK